MGPDGQPVAAGWVSGPAVINIIEMNGPEMTSLSQMSNSPHLKEETSKLKTFKVYFDTPFLYNICAVINKAHWANIEKKLIFFLDCELLCILTNEF